MGKQSDMMEISKYMPIPNIKGTLLNSITIIYYDTSTHKCKASKKKNQTMTKQIKLTISENTCISSLEQFSICFTSL